jgi:hypothetical protein
VSLASQPILLRVLAYMPADLYHCAHCERWFDAAGIGEQLHRELRCSSPPEILDQAERLAARLYELSTRYGDRLHIRVVDPQSAEGFFLSLRHWARRYPTFIVCGQKVVGWDEDALDRLVSQHLAQPPCSLGVGGSRAVRWENVPRHLRRAWHAAGEMLYGMTTFGWAQDMRRTRGEIERLFVLVAFGDLIGLPILPPYYTLRLLPYVVPVIDRWKRALLRERDWTDLTELIEGID